MRPGFDSQAWRHVWVDFVSFSTLRRGIEGSRDEKGHCSDSRTHCACVRHVSCAYTAGVKIVFGYACDTV